MKYYRVRWNESGDNPILFYSEIDDMMWEKRKVEIFGDGRILVAGDRIESAETFLSIEPWPPIEEIEINDCFLIKEIKSDIFEEIWMIANIILKQ